MGLKFLKKVLLISVLDAGRVYGEKKCLMPLSRTWKRRGVKGIWFQQIFQKPKKNSKTSKNIVFFFIKDSFLNEVNLSKIDINYKFYQVKQWSERRKLGQEGKYL